MIGLVEDMVVFLNHWIWILFDEPVDKAADDEVVKDESSWLFKAFLDKKDWN